MKHYVAQLDLIVTACPRKESVKAMLSATYPPNVSDIANNVVVNPIRVAVGKKDVAVSTVRQHLVYTGCEGGKVFAISVDLCRRHLAVRFHLYRHKESCKCSTVRTEIGGICAECTIQK